MCEVTPTPEGRRTQLVFMKQSGGDRRGNENASSCTRQLNISLPVISKYVTRKVFPPLRLLCVVHWHLPQCFTNGRLGHCYLGQETHQAD